MKLVEVLANVYEGDKVYVIDCRTPEKSCYGTPDEILQILNEQEVQTEVKRIYHTPGYISIQIDLPSK